MQAEVNKESEVLCERAEIKVTGPIWSVFGDLIGFVNFCTLILIL